MFDLRGFRLLIDNDVVTKVNDLVVKSGLRERDLSSTYNQLKKQSSDGLTRKDDLEAALYMDQGYSDCRSRSFPGICSSLFDILDTTNNGIVDLSDVMCSLAVLLDGSKSNKLAFLFDVADEDEDRLLSKRQLWKFIRSFLASILLFCTDNSVSNPVSPTAASLSMGDLKRILDEVSVFTCGSVIKFVKSKGGESASQTMISFEDIAEWYSHTGYSICSWFELLDLSKWLPLRASPPVVITHDAGDTASMGQDSASDASLAGSGYSESQGSEISTSVLYQIQLCEDRHLILTSMDAEYVKSISISTGFFAVECALLVRALQYFITEIRNPTVLTSYATSYNYDSAKASLPFVSHEMFIEFIHGLLPNAPEYAANSSENGKLAATLSYVFSLFEQYLSRTELQSVSPTKGSRREAFDDDTDRSELEEDTDTDTEDPPFIKFCYYPSLACGLSLLCRGSKSSKLALGFQLFDLDQDGYLSINEFAHYLASYLTVLLGFSNYAVYHQYFPRKLSPQEKKGKLFSPKGTADSDNDSAAPDDGWLTDVSQELALFIFAECEDRNQGQGDDGGVMIRNNALYINFETFGSWYNNGGFKHMSWIELIDLGKWVEDLPSIPTKAAPASPSNQGDNYDEALNFVWEKQAEASPKLGTLSPKQNSDDYDEEYSVRTEEAPAYASASEPGAYPKYNAEEPEDLSPTAFTLNLYTAQYDCVFPVSSLVVKNVCLFTTRLGLSSLTPSTVANVMLQYVNPNTHLLSKANYNIACNELLKLTKTSLYYGTSETQHDSSRIFCNGYNVLLDSIYYAYSRNSDLTNISTDGADLVDQVDVVDIICGLSILCQG